MYTADSVQTVRGIFLKYLFRNNDGLEKKWVKGGLQSEMKKPGHL